MLKHITSLLVFSLCLVACNHHGNKPVSNLDASVADSLDTSLLSEQELAVLNRVNQIFSEVEAFMREHREDLDEDNPQTGKPYYEEIDGLQNLSTRYMELSQQASNWWYGPLYDHWIQNLLVGTVSHTLQRIEYTSEGDSALVHLTLQGDCETYNKEIQALEEVPLTAPLTVKLVHERNGWYIDDFRHQDYSEVAQFQSIIAFTPYRGDWIPVDGDPLDGYVLTDHEICSDLRGTKFFSYDLQHDTLRLKEVFYDEDYALKEKNSPLRYAVLNTSQDTLYIWQDDTRPAPFVKGRSN